MIKAYTSQVDGSHHAIARQHSATEAAIQRLNGIRGSRIKPGQSSG